MDTGSMERRDNAKKLRCLELYSGIGGMHCALKESDLPFEIIMAADINPVANSVYEYNFDHIRIFKKCLTKLSLDDLENCKSDMIMMSPPCQPFTRVGRRRDMEDERSKSFLHILQLLPKLVKKPDYVVVENVQGFEVSSSRQELLSVLQNLDFIVQEFMLTPLQFGIPNSRLRYYLVAKRKPLIFHCSLSSEISHSIPVISAFNEDGSKRDSFTPLVNFMDISSTTCFDKYLIPQRLYKYFWVMDLVSDNSHCTSCFTKRYGRMVEGAGSVIQMSKVETDLSRFRQPDVMSKNLADFNAGVAQLQLRYFTPREIANLLCFPEHFGFPSTHSSLQLYRVLGNSINVKVVSSLLKILTLGDERFKM